MARRHFYSVKKMRLKREKSLGRYLTLFSFEVVYRVALAWTPVHFNRTWLMVPKNTFWQLRIFYLSMSLVVARGIVQDQDL
jgi:hypothetical protein